MIKVYQTEFSTPKKGGEIRSRGNCFGACIASIFERRSDQVPRFQDLPGDGSWFRMAQEFVNSLGYKLGVVNVKDGESCPDGYLIASGPSPRGKWGHSVIYFDGKMVHDPHPVGDGLLRVDYYLTLTPIKD